MRSASAAAATRNSPSIPTRDARGAPRRALARLQIKHLVALGARRLKAAALVIVEDRLDDRFGFLDQAHEIEVAGGDQAIAHEFVTHPVQQPAPKFAAYQD